MSIPEQCPGAKMIRQPIPEEVKCECGYVVEIWSDEVCVTCKKCGKKISKELLPSCLEWCAIAKQCVGEEKYNQFLKQKKKGRKKESKKGKDK